MHPRASVLIPTHDQPTTLPLTVETVLRQSVPDLEVLLIGDGLTDRARPVIEDLVRRDDRVRLLDFPKGPHHGERYRHDAIVAARSDAVFYLCDDDLLLPDHVADLLALLEDHDLVQSRNGYVTHDGSIRPFAEDLSDEKGRQMHLGDSPRYNAMSITGTAHSRLIYEKVADFWDTTPAGWWPDHHQFAKLLREPSCRAATSTRMTALQFPTSMGRQDWTAEERAAEVLPWHALVLSPGAQDEVDRRYAAGAMQQLIDDRRELATLRAEVVRLRMRVRAQHARIRRLRGRVAEQQRRWDRRGWRRLLPLE